jgi:DNA (cytosine-5)-methyltransferase 1
MLKEKLYSLNTVDRHAVAIKDCVGFALNGYGDYKEGNGHLRAAGGELGGGSETLVCNYAVRRLTPMECERLQGFPDGWTAYGHDGKAISDCARYKALGNSVAVPCVEFILKRMVEAIGQW